TTRWIVHPLIGNVRQVSFTLLMMCTLLIVLLQSIISSYTSPTLIWYKQEVNSSPEYTLKLYSTKVEHASEKLKDRFGAELKDKSVPLKIQKLELSDSAVYYCALQPTVTGNSTTVDENLWKVGGRQGQSVTHVAIRQMMMILGFTGTDIIQTFRLLRLYSGKEQNHRVMKNTFLIIDMDPKHQTQQLHRAFQKNCCPCQCVSLNVVLYIRILLNIKYYYRETV
uniref:Immunoglobulin V-set domain-containing protein n=1 Tax=Salarias fasciatus TaxID=181472 RepID=A0A672HXC4_SALFA